MVFHRTPATLGAAAVAVALLLAGCGGTSSSPKASSSTAPSTTSATAPPSASPSSQSAAPASSSSGSAATTAPSGSAAVTLYVVASKSSFQKTVSALKQAASAQGMMELGHLNQAGVLSQTGLHLKGAESFFIGNPTAGKKAFQMNPAVGTDLPVRMYVWVNPKGATEIGYVKPSDVLGALQPQPKGAAAQQMTMMAGQMDKTMAAIAVQAAGQKSGAAMAMSGRALTFEETASTQSFSNTLSALGKAASAQGMMELGHLNQAGALSQTGLHLKGAESFFIGNPAVGKKAFQMNPAVGIDLPVRMYVWVNPKGQTEIGYIQPSDMLSPLASQMKGAAMHEMSSMVGNMDKAMAAIASGAAK